MVGENTAGSAVLRPPHNELVTPLLTGEGARSRPQPPARAALLRALFFTQQTIVLRDASDGEGGVGSVAEGLIVVVKQNENSTAVRKLHHHLTVQNAPGGRLSLGSQ